MTLLDLAADIAASDRREYVEPTEPDFWQHPPIVEVMQRTCGWKGQTSYVTTKGRRYCDARESSTFGGRYFPGLWEGELRGRYVEECHGGRPRRGKMWSARDAEALAEIEPGQLIPHWRGHTDWSRPLVAIDLSAAYLQLYRHFSTQVEYRPATGDWAPIGGEWLDLDELAAHKLLYTVIVARGFMQRHVTRYRYGEPVEAGTNPWFQPQFCRLLYDCLVAIAHDMIEEMGAVEVMVDAYLLPAEREQAALDLLAERWGVSAKVQFRTEDHGVIGSAWRPGAPPLAPLRPIDPAVRQRLAWSLAGNGPREGALVVMAPDPRRALARGGELSFHVDTARAVV